MVYLTILVSHTDKITAYVSSNRDEAVRNIKNLENTTKEKLFLATLHPYVKISYSTDIGLEVSPQKDYPRIYSDYPGISETYEVPLNIYYLYTPVTKKMTSLTPWYE